MYILFLHYSMTFFNSKSGKFALKNQDNFIIIRNHFLYKNLLFLQLHQQIQQVARAGLPLVYFIQF